MANPTCNTTTLVTDATCYKKPNINQKQQKALKLYAKVLELKAIGGTDYSAALTTTLLTDVGTLICGMTEEQRMAARINIAFVNAAAAGATVPSDIDDKLAVVACLVNVDDDTLDKADLLVTCKLGFHKAYPQ